MSDLNHERIFLSNLVQFHLKLQLRPVAIDFDGTWVAVPAIVLCDEEKSPEEPLAND